MNIDPGMIGDCRTRMLRTLLSCPHAEVYLLRLWCYASQNRTWKWERGTVSNAFLSAVCEYPGDPATLVSSLKTSQWLVTHDDGSVELADYARVNRREIANRRNGQLGGRPRKSQPRPTGNPTETQRKPRGNPPATHAEPTGNPPITQQEPTGNPAGTQTKPTGNPPITQQEPTGNPLETHAEPKNNPTETHAKPTGNPPITQAKPTDNPPETHRKPSVPPIEDSSYPPQDTKTPPLYISPTDRPPEKAASRSRPMKRPTVADVAAYCREKGYDIDPEAFVAHYQAKGWKIGTSPMKCWKSAVVTWVRRRQQTGQRADESKSYRV